MLPRADSRPDWRHFRSDLAGDAVQIDAFHRDRATVELAISDLKKGAGMEHVPSASFSANSAWPQCAVLAYNLIGSTATLGQPGPVDRLTVARTRHVRLITVPRRLVNRPGITTLEGQPLGRGLLGSAADSSDCLACSRFLADQPTGRPGAPPRDRRPQPTPGQVTVRVSLSLVRPGNDPGCNPPGAGVQLAVLRKKSVDQG